MTLQMIITLLVFAFLVISFSLNKIPMSLTSMICMIVLVLGGCIKAKDAIGQFGSTTVITMVSMFIIAAGLNRTQMIKKMSKLVYKVTGGSFTKALAGYVVVTFILGQFIPSITALFALVCPLVISICDELKISPTKMVYSIGITAVSTSFSILAIGPYAAAYIEDNGYLTSYGFTSIEYTIWSETIVKLPVAIFVLLFAIFVAPRLAPDKPDIGTKEFVARKLKEQEPLSPIREVIGYGVFIAVIISLMLQSFGLPSWLIPAAGACFLVLTGVLTEQEAIDNMNLDIIMLYVGVVVLGYSFGNTGAGDVIGNCAAKLMGNTRNNYVIGAVFYIAAFLLTSLLYNRAVPKILVPLALLTCASMGCDPRGPVLMCHVGTMSSVITPMSTSVVPMMMSAGGYSQKTLFKMGIIPSILMCVIAVVIGMTIFPAF